MSTYPSYADFGKSTKDFFTKGFQVGNFKLNVRDQMSKDILATMSGTHDLEKKEATGDFTTKLTCPVLPGYISTTKWTTANVITQELLAKEAFQKGLDVGIEGSYKVDDSSYKGKFLTAYRHELGTVQASFEGGEGEETKPLVNANVVTGYKDFAVGYEGEFDTSEQTFTKNHIAASYVNGDIRFHTCLDNAELFWAGLVYKLNNWIELGLTGTYKSDPEGYTVVGAVTKYVLDCCTALKIKGDSNGIIGLGFETKIKPQATITASTEIDGTKLSEGGHKIGLSFDLEC